MSYSVIGGLVVCLQVKYLSVAGRNLGENSKIGQNFGRNWWFWTNEKRYFLDSTFVQSLSL